MLIDCGHAARRDCDTLETASYGEHLSHLVHEADAMHPIRIPGDLVEHFDNHYVPSVFREVESHLAAHEAAAHHDDLLPHPAQVFIYIQGLHGVLYSTNRRNYRNRANGNDHRVRAG